MNSLKINFKSCEYLRKILYNLLGKTYILQLENGPLEGSVEFLKLENIDIIQLKVNRNIALIGERDEKKFYIFTELNNANCEIDHVSDGIKIQSTAFFGYNYLLKNFDFKFSRNCHICCITGDKDFLSDNDRLKENKIIKNIFCKSNIHLVINIHNNFEGLVSNAGSDLRAMTENYDYENKIIESLSIYFTCQPIRLAPPIPESTRGRLVKKFITTCINNPSMNYSVEDICKLLSYSRTSLSKACLQKFGMVPLKIIKAIKLDYCRHSFTNQEEIYNLHTPSVEGVCKYYGFQSRSHFARVYKDRFGELPGESVAKNKFIGL